MGNITIMYLIIYEFERWHLASINNLVYIIIWKLVRHVILLPKLFWPTVRKKLFYWSRKTFDIRGWRPRIFKNFEITRTIYSNSERSEQFLLTECFFNLFLEVSQISKNNYNSNFDLGEMVFCYQNCSDILLWEKKMF